MKKNKLLESRLGYTFSNFELLALALTHKSFGRPNNERLEFLGDSLLNLIIAEALFEKFPMAREGDLSRLRSALVKGETLSALAQEFEFNEHIKLGDGELKSGGSNRNSILADAVEAVIGAIYLDSDMAQCRDSVLRWYQSRLENVSLATTGKDPKTLLQEHLQERKLPLPKYEVVESLGEAHAMQFVVECDIGKNYSKSTGIASSKRGAEKMAADKMLANLEINPIK